MALAPLFVVDFTTMKANLRLTGSGSGDAEELIDEGIRFVRVNFWKRLGQTRITQILATVYTETPATEDEYVRMAANSAEIVWVRLHLLKTMPTLFMDSSKLLEQWNEEAAFRQGGPSRKQVEKLERELEEFIDILINGANINDPRFRFDVIEPDKAPPRPGDSLYRPELDEGVISIFQDLDVDAEDSL